MPVETRNTRNMSTEKAEKQLSEINTNVVQIHTNIAKLNDSLSTLTEFKQTAIISKIIKNNDFQKYNGNSERGFWTYLENLQKAQSIYNLTDDQMIALSLALATESAYDWIKRHIESNEEISWKTLYEQLQKKFIISDKEDTKWKLRNLKQDKGESLLSFSERIFKMAEIAYTSEELSKDLVKKQLVTIFIEGLENDKIADKLTRKKPETIDAAMVIAARELGHESLVKLRKRTPENNTSIFAIESKENEIIKTLKSLTEKMGELVISSKVEQEKSDKTPTTKMEFTPEGRPICFFCKKAGHIQKNCFSKNNQYNFRNQNNQIYNRNRYTPQNRWYPNSRNNNYYQYNRGYNQNWRTSQNRFYPNPRSRMYSHNNTQTGVYPKGQPFPQ